MKFIIAAPVFATLITITPLVHADKPKYPVVNYPLLTGDEVIGVLIANSTSPGFDNSDLIGATEIIGTTWWKQQHSGTIGRMVEKSDDGYLHFVWTNGTYVGSGDRHVYYNYIDPTGTQGWPGYGYPVENSDRAGYCTIDVDSDGRAFPAFHWREDYSEDYWTAVSFDWFPYTGTFLGYEAPPYPGVDEIIWPHMQMDRNGYLHIISTENVDEIGAPKRHFYIKGICDPISYTINYTSWEEMTFTQTIAGDVATSEVSDRIAFGWTYCKDEGYPGGASTYTTWNNDIWILIDEDGIDPEWDQAFNLTNFIPPDLGWLPDTTLADMDTLRAYTDMSLFFDQNDYLHVAFTTPSYFAIEETHYIHASIIWHWSEQYPDEFVMIHNAFDDYLWNFVYCGYWNVKAQRPSLGQDPNTGNLYCAYQVFDCDSTALSSEGKPSGEIYLSVSTDGGLTWAVGKNITETITPYHAGHGSCFSETYPSMAKLVDGNCHIIYIMDYDADGDPYWPLTQCDVKYHNVPVDLIPTTPLVPQTVPFHVEHAAALFIALNPSGTTTFPAAGGILEYTIQGGNNTPASQTVDIWVDVTLPDSSMYGPVLGPIVNFTMPSGFNSSRDRELYIPGAAPSGDYILNAYLGDYDPGNPTILVEDHLEFTKTGSEDSTIDSWFVDTGEFFEDWQFSEVQHEDLAVFSCYPNPFNNEAAIGYELQNAGYVMISVYDVSGRLVKELVNEWQDIGYHEVSFDGSKLSSGIYICRLEVGDLKTFRKMISVK